jgi:transcriptional regulator with XRE-family HTH domain
MSKNRKLIKAINNRGLKRTEVAILCNLSDVQLRKLCSGEAKNPTTNTLKSLGKVLNVPVTELGFF